jgi:hypothetical protein
MALRCGSCATPCSRSATLCLLLNVSSPSSSIYTDSSRGSSSHRKLQIAAAADQVLTWVRTRPLLGPGISATWPTHKKTLTDQLSRNCLDNTVPTVRFGPKLKALGGHVPLQSLRREPETVMLPLRKPTEPRHGFHLYAFFLASTRLPKLLKTKTRWFWL